MFQARGVVEKVDAERGDVVVRHEAIPDYMDAMTMPFHVRDAQTLQKLKCGDAITFRLNVAEREGWIDQIKAASSTNSPLASAETPALPDLDPIQPGQPFPSATLTDEHGRSLDLSGYRGQALAITFIFTRCPYPNFCPLMTENFGAVQRALTADAAAPKNWQLLSVTIDPEHDTPETLRAYAALHKADPDHWRFATGTLRAITTLALRCGLSFWDANGGIQHNLRTIVIDAKGNVRRVFTNNEWKPAELAAELRAATEAP
jgi:protein SCO1/2